ncbi:MAG: arginine deiminase [Bacteroidales bacterium]|nr:arginine deiminase [Bacteroidales bacterium]
MKISVQSEIGKLKAVLLHTPGVEVENMTPKMAQRALYSDILNLDIAKHEHSQLSGVLSKVCDVYYVRDLLLKVLEKPDARKRLLGEICRSEQAVDSLPVLQDMAPEQLCSVLVEGLPATIDSLTSFLNEDYYSLFPLYNLYFTRDAAVTIGGNALICAMANKVRCRESLIMKAIYSGSGAFECDVLDASSCQGLSMEGGDILVAREDVLLIGNGVRTTSQGIDWILSRMCASNPEGRRHVIVQQLPSNPESFIHLDMVFTMLDRNQAMVYEPLIMGGGKYKTIHIVVENGKVAKISYEPNILAALRGAGMDIEPVSCGGRDDSWMQAREQWHSGANCFAFAPGKVLTYQRNAHTIGELVKKGYACVSAWDVIEGKADLKAEGRMVVTIEGSELPRGGGGARCMTMPLCRESVNW